MKNSTVFGPPEPIPVPDVPKGVLAGPSLLPWGLQKGRSTNDQGDRRQDMAAQVKSESRYRPTGPESQCGVTFIDVILSLSASTNCP